LSRAGRFLKNIDSQYAEDLQHLFEEDFHIRGIHLGQSRALRRVRVVQNTPLDVLCKTDQTGLQVLNVGFVQVVIFTVVDKKNCGRPEVLRFVMIDQSFRDRVALADVDRWKAVRVGLTR